MTDSKARTNANVRAAVLRAGGSFSRVLYQFQKKGQLTIKLDGRPFDQVLEQVIEIGAEDVEDAGEGQVNVLPYYGVR